MTDSQYLKRLGQELAKAELRLVVTTRYTKCPAGLAQGYEPLAGQVAVRESVTLPKVPSVVTDDLDRRRLALLGLSPSVTLWECEHDRI